MVGSAVATRYARLIEQVQAMRTKCAVWACFAALAAGRTPYDRATSCFAPDGTLHQVDYARAAHSKEREVLDYVMRADWPMVLRAARRLLRISRTRAVVLNCGASTAR